MNGFHFPAGTTAREPYAVEVGAHTGCRWTSLRVVELPPEASLRFGTGDEEMFVRHEKVPEGAWISVTATPLKGRDGAVEGGIVVFRDITMSKQAAKELAKRTGEDAHDVAVVLGSGWRPAAWIERLLTTMPRGQDSRESCPFATASTSLSVTE